MLNETFKRSVVCNNCVSSKSRMQAMTRKPKWEITKIIIDIVQREQTINWASSFPLKVEADAKHFHKFLCHAMMNLIHIKVNIMIRERYSLMI